VPLPWRRDRGPRAARLQLGRGAALADGADRGHPRRALDRGAARGAVPGRAPRRIAVAPRRSPPPPPLGAPAAPRAARTAAPHDLLIDAPAVLAYALRCPAAHPRSAAERDAIDAAQHPSRRLHVVYTLGSTSPSGLPFFRTSDGVSAADPQQTNGSPP